MNPTTNEQTFKLDDTNMKFKGMFIGKGGTNINQLKQEFKDKYYCRTCRIDVRDNSIHCWAMSNIDGLMLMIKNKFDEFRKNNYYCQKINLSKGAINSISSLRRRFKCSINYNKIENTLEIVGNYKQVLKALSIDIKQVIESKTYNFEANSFPTFGNSSSVEPSKPSVWGTTNTAIKQIPTIKQSKEMKQTKTTPSTHHTYEAYSDDEYTDEEECHWNEDVDCFT